LNTFLDSDCGTYWSSRYYSADPDVVVVEPIHKQEHIVETSGFTRLREEARRLQKGDMTEAQAIAKACELHPDLAASHINEMRSIVA